MRRAGRLLAVVALMALALALAGCGGGGSPVAPSEDAVGKPPASFANPALVFHRASSMGLKYCITLGRWDASGRFQTRAITDPGGGDDAHAAWNPVTPTRLAFLRGGTGADGIYTVNTDGTGLALEYPANGAYPPSEHLCWFPEGDRLLFVSSVGKTVVVLDLAKGLDDPLRSQAIDLPWIVGVPYGISLRKATVGDPGWLLAFAADYNLYGPDGEVVGFRVSDLWVTKLTEAADGTMQIAWDGQDGRPSPCTWVTDQGQTHPVWDATGTRLGFAQGFESNVWGVGWVTVTESEGSVGFTDHRLCASGWGEHPSWSPDGSWLAYEGQGYELFRVSSSATGAAGENLTNSPRARDCAPDWNPHWVP